jgi:hypothetical protein
MHGAAHIASLRLRFTSLSAVTGSARYPARPSIASYRCRERRADGTAGCALGAVGLASAQPSQG